MGSTMVKESKESERSVVLSSFRLPEKMVERIDAIADRETRSRANCIQVLLQEALNSREEKEREEKKVKR